MTNKNAQKLITKITDDLEQNGIITNTLVEDLKTLRPYAVDEKRPVVAKAIRLVYEHVEKFETFAISIPSDEDIVDEETGETLARDEREDSDPKESLLYVLALIQNEELYRNKQELRDYNDRMKDYAEMFA